MRVGGEALSRDRAGARLAGDPPSGHPDGEPVGGDPPPRAQADLPGEGGTGCPDRGQATVELAIVLPLVALAVLGVLQVLVTTRDQVAVINAARVGAREAALGSGRPWIHQAVAGALGTAADVSIRTEGDFVTVTVSMPGPRVPPVGVFAPRRLSASVTVLREPTAPPP